MRQSDRVITTAQQAAALLFALASKSQATCSVRLYCHCPRDDVSEINTQGCGNQQPSQLGNEKRGLGQTAIKGVSPRSALRCVLHRIGNINRICESRLNEACTQFGGLISMGNAKQYKHLSDFMSLTTASTIFRGRG